MLNRCLYSIDGKYKCFNTIENYDELSSTIKIDFGKSSSNIDESTKKSKNCITEDDCRIKCGNTFLNKKKSLGISGKDYIFNGIFGVGIGECLIMPNIGELYPTLAPTLASTLYPTLNTKIYKITPPPLIQ